MAKARVRFRIDLGSSGSVGPGKIALLEAIERTGSLSSAARELGMSYRYAWSLLMDLNECFTEPTAKASVGGRSGGGAAVTPFGRELIAAFRSLEAEVQERAKRHLIAVVRRARQTTEHQPRAPQPLRRPPRKARS